MSCRRTTDYIAGVGYVRGSLKKRIPYKRFLERDIISKREYDRFRKIHAHMELKENRIRHDKSIVEKILRKYNTPLSGGHSPI